MLSALLLAVLLQQQPTYPAPTGLVNDFAGAVPAASVARMERTADDVRRKSGGEIAVVTLRDIGERDKAQVALEIGRQWKVGAAAAVGDRTRNAGVVILVVPKETSSDGRGHCTVATGQGSEGFLTDGEVASLCRAAVPYFQRRDYGRGLELLTFGVAQEFAREFAFTLDTATVAAAPAAQVPRPAPRGRSINPLFLMAAIFVITTLLNSRRRGGGRRRGGFPGIIMLPMGGGGSWGGGGSFGGGGGGFGGFGGGGGFSGGGGGSDW